MSIITCYPQNIEIIYMELYIVRIYEIVYIYSSIFLMSTQNTFKRVGVITAIYRIFLPQPTLLYRCKTTEAFLQDLTFPTPYIFETYMIPLYSDKIPWDV